MKSCGYALMVIATEKGMLLVCRCKICCYRMFLNEGLLQEMLLETYRELLRALNDI